MSSGLFITFEGPEGSGKTTQIAAIKGFMISHGFEVVVTREPGGTMVGDKIRSILLGNETGALEPETEIFLMLAQRTEHLKKVIIPAVKSGKVLLCDRYFDSSMAYQGYGRGIDPDKIRNAHKTFLPGFLPDYTVLLHISPEKGIERARHGGTKSLDRIESEDIEFHKRIFDGYHQLAKDEPERFISVSANDGVPEQISEKIINQLLQRVSALGYKK